VSAIYWHSPSEEDVRLRGSERALMQCMVKDIAATFIPSYGYEERLNPSLPEYLRRDDPRRFQNLVTAFGVDMYENALFTDLDGTPLSNFSLQLNTILAIGNDPLCLAARLHAQCEIHCYVEGPNRAWLAEVIESGLEAHIFRDGEGWGGVTNLLRVRDDEPVVTSYSVCYSFPTHSSDQGVPWQVWKPTRIDEYGEAAWDDWYDLPEDERWRLALGGIRGIPEAELELRPRDLRRPFGHARSLLDLFHTPVRATT
jgi:hypothetical protein